MKTAISLSDESFARSLGFLRTRRGNVPIPLDVGVLAVDSVVNVTQIATIDRDVLEERIGALPDWMLGQLDAGLQRAIGLPRT